MIAKVSSCLHSGCLTTRLKQWTCIAHTPRDKVQSRGASESSMWQNSSWTLPDRWLSSQRLSCCRGGKNMYPPIYHFTRAWTLFPSLHPHKLVTSHGLCLQLPIHWLLGEHKHSVHFSYLWMATSTNLSSESFLPVGMAQAKRTGSLSPLLSWLHTSFLISQTLPKSFSSCNLTSSATCLAAIWSKQPAFHITT